MRRAGLDRCDSQGNAGCARVGVVAWGTGAVGPSCSDNQGSNPTVNPTTGALFVAFENFDTPDENQYLSVASYDGGNTFVGPFFAPHAPADFVGLPYAHPSPSMLLGTDNLGRDVLSRFLWGGRSVLGLSLAATLLGLALGVAIGLVAAYARNLLDDVLMRGMDVILAFPSIVLALVAVATVGPKLWLLARAYWRRNS